MRVNFLAHVFLSGDNFPLAFGNLIADQIKGKEINNFPFEVQQGITFTVLLIILQTPTLFSKVVLLSYFLFIATTVG